MKFGVKDIYMVTESGFGANIPQEIEKTVSVLQ